MISKLHFCFSAVNEFFQFFLFTCHKMHNQLLYRVRVKIKGLKMKLSKINIEGRLNCAKN